MADQALVCCCAPPPVLTSATSTAGQCSCPQHDTEAGTGDPASPELAPWGAEDTTLEDQEQLVGQACWGTGDYHGIAGQR